MKTKIHTKSYDLTSFKHPGGNKALELIKNKDGTCLFELYHPFSKRNYLNTVLTRFAFKMTLFNFYVYGI